jgi:hypothetical protein
MSDSLFGGSTSTINDISAQLAQIQKNLGALTAQANVQRNPNLTADAVVMSGSCPAPLVGCNASALYEATGGQLTCPPLDQAPDPIITDHKGRICYAPESLREAWKGKSLNIRDLMEKYAVKLVKMLENGNSLAVAVEAARAGPKGSPIIVNYYANNPFVRTYAAGGSMFATAGGAGAAAAPPAIQGARAAIATLFQGAGANFTPPVGLDKDTLAAVLTKFSNHLDVNAGALLVAELLNSVDGASPQGVFDADNSGVADAGRAEANRKPGFGLAGGLDGVNELTSENISFPTHSYILNTLFPAIYATHRDGSRRARLVETLDGLAIALEFGEIGKNFDSTLNRRRQAITAANSAVAFLPKAFRNWISAGKADNTVGSDPRFVLGMFVKLSILLTVIEAFDTSSGQKWIGCVKALRVAFNNMRATESDLQDLLKQKASGTTVVEETIDRAMRAKKGAAQSYVVQTVRFGEVLANLLGIDIKGNAPTFAAVGVGAPYGGRHFLEAYNLIASTAASIQTQDPKLSGAMSAVQAQLLFVADFGGYVAGGAGPGVGIFSGTAKNVFFNKVITLSKLGATQAIPDEEVHVNKYMFATPQAASIASQTVSNADHNQFSASLPGDQANFCKVKVSSDGKFVYLWARTPNPAMADGAKARLQTAKFNISSALENGDRAQVKVLINNFTDVDLTIDDLGFIVSLGCEPLSSGEDTLARKAHVLGSLPIDQMISRWFQTNLRNGVRGFSGADLQRMQTQGLNKNERDAYSSLVVLFMYLSGKMMSPQMLASIIYEDEAISNALVNSMFLLSSASPGQTAATKSLARATTFASHGPRLGGGEDMESFEGGEEFEGGEDWESFADKLLHGGRTNVPVHNSPEVIVDAVSRVGMPHKYGKNKKEIKDLEDKLAKLGYDIPYFYDDKCPSYIRSHNNTFGTPGEKRWIETKNPWSKCQEQMGFQFVSKNGFCYPHGMTCFPEDDLLSTTHKTVESVDNWIQLAKIYNSIKQKQYVEFLEGEKARIRLEPQNADLTEKEVEELAKSHVPAELAGVPEFAAVQTMVTLSDQLEKAVGEITSTSDPAQREEIKNILRRTGSMRDEWADDDKEMETLNLNRIASNVLEEAKKCTDASLAVTTNIAADNITNALSRLAAPGGTATSVADVMPGGVLPSTVKAGTLNDATNKCDVLKTGDGPADAVLIPKVINQRIDQEKLARGEPVDPIVNWWRTYYGAKAVEEARSINKVANKLSPFGNASVSTNGMGPQSDEARLMADLEKALGKRGASLALRK